VGWFDYIYDIDWQEEGTPFSTPVNIEKLDVEGIEAPISEDAWRQWLDKWRKSASQQRKDIFTKRNQRRLYFVDGRKKIYSRVLLKGGVVGVFVEILAGTVEWSLQRGIQVMFDTITPPRSERYFLVIRDIQNIVDEPLPEKIVLLPGEMEFGVVFVDSEDDIDDTLASLMMDLEKREIESVKDRVEVDDMVIIWDGSLLALGNDFLFDKIPLVGFNRYMAMRYMPHKLEDIYDVLFDLSVSERTPLFAITGLENNMKLVSSYIRLISPPEDATSTMRGISLFEVLSGENVDTDSLIELFDFFALMLPRLATATPFGKGTETLFPLLAVEGNLVHYFIPKEYVAYLITKEVVQRRK